MVETAVIPNASNLTGLCCESFESISQVCFKNDGNDLN